MIIVEILNCQRCQIIESFVKYLNISLFIKILEII